MNRKLDPNLPIGDDGDLTLRPTRLETIGEVDLAKDFQRPSTGIRVMGVLVPVKACITEQLVITGSSAIVGRETSADLVVPDSAVSKRHARITCKHGLYTIEDLDSSNGTYVDNVPVISCALHGGDAIRIGRNLFVFDRIRVLEASVDQ